MTFDLRLSRRAALQAAAGLTVLTFAPVALAEEAAPKAEDDIKAFTGGKDVKEGGVSLELPEIAENGNTVPLRVLVDSPMTAESYVKRVLIVADGNPRPGVGTFRFSAKSGRAEASTRIRLAKTQNVIAVAELSDGTFTMAKKAVKVTIGGCGG
jgi:sulfur-oxidizing protein SoxY